jgi:hypothetical protein
MLADASIFVRVGAWGYVIIEHFVYLQQHDGHVHVALLDLSRIYVVDESLLFLRACAQEWS